MIVQQIARIIAHFVVFLEFTDEDDLDPEAAAQVMEQLAADVRSLDKDALRELVDAFNDAALYYDHPDAQDAVRSIASAFGLDELLAADNSVRQAIEDGGRATTG